MARLGGSDRGLFEEKMSCPKCKGTGKIAGKSCKRCEDTCGRCYGTGKDKKQSPCKLCGGGGTVWGKVGTGTWWIRYIDQHHNEHREKVGTKSEARTQYERRKTDVRQDKFKVEDAARSKKAVLFAQAMKGYLEQVKPITRDWDHVKRRAEKWVTELGEQPLESIDSALIKRWRSKQLAAEFAPATVNRSIALLRHFFNYALDNRMVKYNPLHRFPMLPEDNERVRYLKPEEQRALKSVMEEAYWPWVLISLGTGLRLSEQLHLRWDDLDWEAMSIRVKKPKAKKAQYIPMREDVAELFRELPSRMRSEWCFPATDGKRPMPRGGSIRGTFEKALEKAGIKDFSWHDLRHTFASRLAMAGVPIYEIQKLMRHSTIKMTERYAHLSPKHLRGAIEQLALEPKEVAAGDLRNAIAMIPLEPTDAAEPGHAIGIEIGTDKVAFAQKA